MSAPGNIFVPLAFLGWTPFIFYLYKKLDARLVPIIAYVAGWMFLPCANYDIFLLKNTKSTVLGLGIFAGAYFCDHDRLLNFKFHIADTLIVLWCTASFFSSVFNGLGFYDGLSTILYTAIKFGLPYYIGRIYFTDTDALKTLALAIFLGGVIYIPFCWIEMIISPQMHRLTYGFSQTSFAQSLRDNGGYRPSVYMDHGLMTSMWMMLASLLGSWLFYCKALPKKIVIIPSLYLLLMLIFTTVMMQSAGAVAYLLIALGALYLSSRYKNFILLALLLLCPYLYIVARVGYSWDGRNFTDYIAEKFSPSRASSLQFRFDNETILLNKAFEGSFFGLGGWNRSRVFDEDGKDIAVTDGGWIIVYGMNGIYGLSVFLLMIQLPVFIFIFRIKPEVWKTQSYAAPAAMAVFSSITQIDNLLNAMFNPIYMVVVGGLIGLFLKSSNSILPPEESNISDMIEKIITQGSRFIGAPPSINSTFIR